MQYKLTAKDSKSPVILASFEHDQGVWHVVSSV